MSFWKIAWRNMQQRALASSLTALSMALGVAVMIAVIVIHSVAVRQFEQNAQGYHLIVGGKGGALQLVLSTVYHVGQPLYPIPYTYYQKFLPGGRVRGRHRSGHPDVPGRQLRIAERHDVSRRRHDAGPVRQDSIRHVSRRHAEVVRVRAGRPEFQDGVGEHFTRRFEAVVGSVVAAQSGLKLGDEINPTHGLGGEGHKHEGFKVVGILKPTGTANDRAVFINIEGFYLLEGHASQPHDEERRSTTADERDGHAEADERASPNEHAHEAARARHHEHAHHAAADRAARGDVDPGAVQQPARPDGAG